MRTKHGLKGFMFQTDNVEFNSRACKDLVAARGGKLVTNCPYSPKTMSIIERSWRTIGEMATVMLLHCGLAENYWEEATLYAVDIYDRVPQAKSNKTGLRKSPYDKSMERYHSWMNFVRSVAGTLRSFRSTGKHTRSARSRSCTREKSSAR